MPALKKREEELEEIRRAVEGEEEERKEEEIELPVKKRAVAPLFIKLERYDEILNSLSELKRIMSAIKASLSTLTEIERLRGENLNLLKDSISRVERKIIALDSQFLRPPSYREVEEREYSREEGVEIEGAISTLKSQVEKLRSELEGIE